MSYDSAAFEKALDKAADEFGYGSLGEAIEEIANLRLKASGKIDWEAEAQRLRGVLAQIEDGVEHPERVATEALNVIP